MAGGLVNKSVVSDLLEFLNSSPTAFHAVDEAENRLKNAGFEQISEREDWKLKSERSISSREITPQLLHLRLGRRNGFHIVGAHTDSLCLMLKPISKGGYLEVGVQTYGGGLWHTWFDRDWTVAGRLMIEKRKDGSASYLHKLVRINEPIMRIPTLAIHLDRNVNDGFKVNTQTQLVPVLATSIKAELNKLEAESIPIDDGVEDVGKKAAEQKNIDSQKHHPVLLKLLAANAGCEPDDI